MCTLEVCAKAPTPRRFRFRLLDLRQVGSPGPLHDQVATRNREITTPIRVGRVQTTRRSTGRCARHVNAGA